MFVCLFCFTLQNKLIAEHLVLSCQCHVWSRDRPRKSELDMIPVPFSFVLFRFYVMLFILLLLIFISLLFYLFTFYMKLLLFLHVPDVPGCSGMFRNVPCSWFYRRAVKLLFISLITSNIVCRFDLSRTQNLRRIIACLILLVLKVHVFKKRCFLKENLFFDMIK